MSKPEATPQTLEAMRQCQREHAFFVFNREGLEDVKKLGYNIQLTFRNGDYEYFDMRELTAWGFDPDAVYTELAERVLGSQVPCKNIHKLRQDVFSQWYLVPVEELKRFEAIIGDYTGRWSDEDRKFITQCCIDHPYDLSIPLTRTVVKAGT